MRAVIMQLYFECAFPQHPRNAAEETFGEDEGGVPRLSLPGSAADHRLTTHIEQLLPNERPMNGSILRSL